VTRAAARSTSPTSLTSLSSRNRQLPGTFQNRVQITFATRLRQGGADPAQVQALLGHASVDTAARYFRSGSAENAAVIERIFDH